MKTNELLARHLEIIGNQQSVHIPSHLFAENDPNYQYRCLINEYLPDGIGVYLWSDSEDNIIYIGKAGTLKTDGTYKQHTIRQRNLATRGKVNGRDVLTANYVQQIMMNDEMPFMTITALNFDTEEIIPAFFEAQLLQDYYNIERELPKYNKSF